MARPKNMRQGTFADPIMRKLHNAKRREMATAAAARAEHEIAVARKELQDTPDLDELREEASRRNSVITGLLPNLKAVMASYGYTLPVFATPADQAGGWTDFNSIHIDFNEAMLTDLDTDTVNTDLLRILAGEARGVFYHELGHNRFTVPMEKLLTLARNEGYVTSRVAGGRTAQDEQFHKAWNILEDQRMESAVVEDSPHIASYLTVLVLRLIATPEKLADNFPLLVGRWYLPTKVLQASKRAYTAKYGDTHTENEIRECVYDYCRADTATDMLTQIELFVNLLRDLRIDSDNQFDTHERIVRKRYVKSDPTEEPEDDTPEPDQAVTDPAEHEPETADDEDEGDDAPTESDEGDDSAETDDDESETDDGEASKDFDNDADEDFSDEEAPIDGETESDEDGDESDEGDGSGDDTDEGDADSDTDEDADGGTSAGATSDDEDDDEDYSDEDTLQDALDEALDNWNDDDTLESDVGAINDAYENGASALPYYDRILVSDDEDMVAQAHELKSEIVEAFQIATADMAPVWQGEQRNGVLDVRRFVTRQHGERNYFRNYSDHGEPGTDLAITLLMDVSSSMRDTGNALGAAAWAVKNAGDECGIDTEVAVFDTEGAIVWSVDDRADFVPNLADRGGTDPGQLFEEMLSEERDAKLHIVLVMTDGEWTSEGRADLTRYSADNRYTVFFEYLSPHNPKANELRNMVPDQAHQHNQGILLNYGPDEAYVIEDLFTIPEILENILVMSGGN